MPTITALEMQQRNKRRVNVHLDGAFAFGLALNAALQLKVGQTLAAAEIEALRAADQVEKAYERALLFLSYRPRAETEVRRNLAKHDTPQPTIELVIDRLRAANYVNDAEFAALWVDDRATHRPRGRRALQFELRQKGVPPEIIEAALQDLDEVGAAREVAHKQAARLAPLAGAELRHKLYGYLARRGFDSSTIQAVLDELITSHESHDLPYDYDSED